MLVTKNISYSLQQQFLTRDISMQIPQGTFFTIAGPNGSGKSTLLKQLTGALHPTTGNIFLEGKALSSWKKCALAKTRGVLSQYTQTAFPMSVLEMVMLGRYAAGNTERRTQQQDIAEWALDVVRMSAFATRNIQTLSGGEQQRVHLARVLAQIYHAETLEGKYVFLDEPTSSLDIAQQYHVLKVLHQLSADRGLTVGVILHDLHLAALFSDLVFLLKKGKMKIAGTPTETLIPENVSQIFDIPLHILSTTIKHYSA